MTTTVTRPGRRGSPAPAAPPDGAPPERMDTLGDLAKFTVAVALLAILADAAVGHALLWENDPYWTYWVTKTFLIATVFGLGTAWLGAGVARGAAITLVHTVVLTVYYWSLSPIGMPSHPEWLDLEHTWATGVPVHFGVIYLGYLVALWLWRRRPAGAGEATEPSVASDAGRALVVGAAIVVVAGLLEAAALGEFPGVTWFVVRLLIAVPFTLAWWAVAGRDRAAAVGGGITLALVLASYSHFLGPVGLPDTSLRIVAQDPPPADVHWLDYREEFLVALPITLVVAVGAYVLASEGRKRLEVKGPAVLATAVGLVALVGLGAVAAKEAGPDGDRATLTGAGDVSVEQGPFFRGRLVPADGDIRLVAEQRNPRVTPLPPHDRVELDATVTHPDGTVFEVRSRQPMVDDPRGRFGTWWGVGFEEWHHGRSGIGSPLVPSTKSDVAVFALAEVRADGRLVATGVPVHVMTMEHPHGRLELDVGDPSAPLPSLPDGHLRVVWSDYVGGRSDDAENARYALGTGVLLLLLVMVLAALRSPSAALAP